GARAYLAGPSSVLDVAQDVQLILVAVLDIEELRVARAEVQLGADALARLAGAVALGLDDVRGDEEGGLVAVLAEVEEDDQRVARGRQGRARDQLEHGPRAAGA